MYFELIGFFHANDWKEYASTRFHHDAIFDDGNQTTAAAMNSKFCRKWHLSSYHHDLSTDF